MFANKCRVSTWLAYLMLAYLISSLYYYVRTRSIGTPFNDSLTAAQLALKNKSSNSRWGIFAQGLLVGVVVIYFFRPFRECSSNSD